MGGSAYTTAVRLFYEIANVFFWPVAIGLLLALGYALVDLGAALTEAWRRRRERVVDLAAVALALGTHLTRRGEPGAALAGIDLPATVERFWARVAHHLAVDQHQSHLDLWMDEALRTEELAIAARLDRGRALVRLGPMLGLAGTIIPLGPALQALLGGDLGGMVNHLVVGFGAVVCGLMASGVAYCATLARERWSRQDLKQMEDLAELVLRQLAAREEPVHARIRQA